MKELTSSGIGLLGVTEKTYFSEKDISRSEFLPWWRLYGKMFCALPTATEWTGFIAEASEWMKSGCSSRFVQYDEGRVLDKKTGRVWPMSLFEAAKSNDFAD